MKKKNKLNEINISDNLKNDPLKYYKLSKKIFKFKKKFKKISISFLADFTTELFDPFIKVELAKRKNNSDIFFEPYNQIEQIIYNKNHKIYKKKFDIIIIALRLENLLPNIFSELIYSPLKINKKINEIKKRILNLINNIRKNNNYSKIIFFNFNFIENNNQGFTSTSSKINLDSLSEKINSYLITLTKEFNGLFIFDFKKISENVGLNNFFDKKLFLLSRMPFTPDAQIELSKFLSRFINAILKVPKKCLVVDADNTIWGGVVGEDYIDGIKLSEDFPGNIYKSFQRFLINLRKKGILLALVSKNNQQDVLEVFKNHEDCLLKRKHFSTLEINWNDKATNIKKVAKDLNIGLDALVFFDDNPVERELIRNKLPKVNVIEVPKDPLNYEESIEKSEFFDHVFLTKDDLNRSNMYIAEKKRKNVSKQNTNINDYLASLKTKVQIGNINKDSIQRCSQLINKTNQFNLTVRRKSEVELKNILLHDAVGLWIRASDKFGDSGMVGVAIAVHKKKNNSWYIDTFLLSCRVIGRGIEDIFLSELIQKIKNNSTPTQKYIIGEYIKKEKNIIAKDFYKKHNFSYNKEKKGWVKKISNFKYSKFRKLIKVIKK